MIRRVALIVSCICMLTQYGLASAKVERSESETKEAGISGISTIRFNDIERARLTYTGVEGADRIVVDFTKTVKAGDEETCDSILGDIGLDVSSSGGEVVVDLSHPGGDTGRSWVKKLFDRAEWEVVVKVTGRPLST